MPPPRSRHRTPAPGACAPDEGDLLHRAQLHAVPSTLLIPLAARAQGDRCFPWLACGDAVAADLLARLGGDAAASLPDLPTVLNVLWRTRVIKDAAQAFFARHPAGLGANLGCGLSSHFQWLDTGANQWLDADLPEVVALRRPLLPPQGPRLRCAETDIARPGWWQGLGLPQGAGVQPVLIVCEGVLMYLQPAQVQAVLQEFAGCAPSGSCMVLDTLTHWAVGHAGMHPSVGPTGAQFRWGVARVEELAAAHPRLRLLQAQSAAECYGWPGMALESLWRPWLGAPLYGMAMLGVR